MTNRLGLSWQRATGEEHLGGAPVKAIVGASKFIRDLPTAIVGTVTREEATMRPRTWMLDGTVTAMRNTVRAATQGRILGTLGNAANVFDEAINDATDALTGMDTYVIDTSASQARASMRKTMNIPRQ